MLTITDEEREVLRYIADLVSERNVCYTTDLPIRAISPLHNLLDKELVIVEYSHFASIPPYGEIVMQVAIRPSFLGLVYANAERNRHPIRT